MAKSPSAIQTAAGRAVGAPYGRAGLGSNNKVPTDQLGSGTASSSTFLRGDQSYASLSAGGFAAQAANVVLAGPTMGGSATPTFRALVRGDIVELIGLADLTDVTAKTGTGTEVVMSGSPTIVTPTVASFVNAGHDHTNAAGGGQLTVTTAIKQGTGKLLGRTTAGTGLVEEITVNPGLTLASAALDSKAPQVDVFTATGTWTKPAGCKSVAWWLIGGGGSGGTGSRRATSNNRAGGQGGGGGALTTGCGLASDFGGTETVTIGAGGAAAAHAGTDTTDGTVGNDGGDTTFGTYATAKGGKGGKLGAQAATTANTAGAGTAPGGIGGISGTGAGGEGGASGGGGAGGGGGGITSVNVQAAGGAGGPASGDGKAGGAGGAAAGTNNGTAGTAAVNRLYAGSGGGGSGSNNGGASGTGGAGGAPGGGGGGSGACVNGSAVGNSGAGADGKGVIVSYF